MSARLDELERLIAAATPGPVTLGTGRPEDGYMEGLLAPYSDEHGTRRRVLAQFNCNFPHEGDGQLFAALRNAAPALLAIARAAELFAVKLEAVHDDPRYQAVWMSYQIHGNTYSEPTYEAEFKALRSALAALAASENVGAGGPE